MLEVRDLAYARPRASRSVLGGLGFSVAGGEIFGLLGPAGAGKTTLQRILAGLIRDYAGTVSFQGRELRDWGREFFERIGVSGGFTGHFRKLTAAENLAYFGRLYARKPLSGSDLLEQVGLARDAGRRVEDFSRGMLDRLGVARALIHGPDAVFLDEPTAGLDTGEAGRMADLVAAQRERGRCVVLTTRDADLADALCDRVAFLVDGKILSQGSPRDLKAGHGKAGASLEETFRGIAGRGLS